jgi:hypothetical protein
MAAMAMTAKVIMVGVSGVQISTFYCRNPSASPPNAPQYIWNELHVIMLRGQSMRTSAPSFLHHRLSGWAAYELEEQFNFGNH